MPSIAAGVAATAGVIGTAVSAYSSLSAGAAQSKEAAYQAQVAKNNQTVANENAEHSAQAGEAKAQEESLADANREGAIRAAIAANNIDVNSGSAEDVQVSQREIDRLDTLTNLNNAMLAAYGYRNDATNFGDQAALDTAESQQATIAGDIGAAGTIAGNASSMGFKWAAQNSAGGGLNPSQTQYLANPDESAAGT